MNSSRKRLLEEAAGRHPAYAAILAGRVPESVRGGAARRIVLCIYRGWLIERIGTCTADHRHVCDLLGGETTHNGRCQTCDRYEPE